MTQLKIVTLGVYGLSEEEFFKALQEAHVDTFVDVRRRRGVRGSQYAFANSQRLQSRLAELGIRYVHALELSPSNAIRSAQYEVDREEGIAKRKRTTLSPAFVEAYTTEVLDPADLDTFLTTLPDDAAVVALFCVEREASACHRSLIAERLQSEYGFPVTHLQPG